jgi:hypothetical protein
MHPNEKRFKSNEQSFEFEVWTYGKGQKSFGSDLFIITNVG